MVEFVSALRVPGIHLMKLIKCIVHPDSLHEVIQAVENVTTKLIVSHVVGRGRQKAYSVFFRNVEYQITLLPEVIIEMVVCDYQVEDVVKAVVERARSGGVGDGQIFVLPFAELYHVRTGFMDVD